MSIIFRKDRNNNSKNILSNSSINHFQEAETEELNLYKYFNRHSKSKRNEHNNIYSSIPTTNLCIVNLSTRAGSTFFSLNLAKAISLRKISVAVIEAPMEKPYIYDYIGIEEKVRNHPWDNQFFYSYLSEINRKHTLDMSRNISYDGINWIIGNPKEKAISDWNELKMQKLLHAKKDVAVKIFDCGSHFRKSYVQSILDDMDYIFVMVDPLPVEVMHHEEEIDYFNHLNDKKNNVYFIFNKWNKGVDEKALISFMEIKPLEKVPYIPSELVYQSIYQCKIPYDNQSIRKEFGSSLEKIADKIIHIRK